jgi:hypothetical protein
MSQNATGDVEETMLNDVEKQFERIFSILGIQKKRLVRIRESGLK